MPRYKTYAGIFLDIDESASLGDGTTGRVYKHPSQPTLCVKIYHSSQVEAHAPKVAAMISAPPAGLTERTPGSQRVQAAWPIETVSVDGTIVGFTMPLVDSCETWSLTETLTKAESDELPRKMLLAIAINLAAMVANIHKAGSRVTDFNPANFRVHKRDGFVCLIDCDGYQISKGAGAGYFRAEVAWDAHLIPAAVREDGALDVDALNQNALNQDCWGLAILCFRLLNRNMLPYDGHPKPGKETLIPSSNSLRARSCQELYPFGRRASKLLAPLPLSLHEKFPRNIRSAFDSVFQGNSLIAASEWLNLLAPYLSDERDCSLNRNHWRLGSSCDQCAVPLVPNKVAKPSRARHGPAPAGRNGLPGQVRPPPTHSVPWGWIIGVGLLVGLPVFVNIIGSRVQADKSRSLRLIESAKIVDGTGREFPVVAAGGDTPQIVASNASVNLTLSYSGANVGKDDVVIRLTGSGSRVSCPPIVLNSPSGTAQCGFINLQEASYTFLVLVNGNEAAKYQFTISDPDRAKNLISDVRIAQNVRSRFRSVQDSRQLVGAPTPVGIAIRYDRKHAGDYIDTELYLGGKLLDTCQRSYLDGPQSGEYWCQFDSVGAGLAEFRVKVNGIAAGRYNFSIAASTVKEYFVSDPSAASVDPAYSSRAPTYGQPSRERRSNNPDSSRAVSCVLPSGAEIAMTYQRCRDSAGVIFSQ